MLVTALQSHEVWYLEKGMSRIVILVKCEGHHGRNEAIYIPSVRGSCDHEHNIATRYGTTE